MLTTVIFRHYMGTPPAEMIGTGSHRFDFYVQQGANISKYVVFSENYDTAVGTFCTRFGLTCRSKKKLTQDGISAYRLYLRNAINPRIKICNDAVCKRMV